jgi:hypothetical protein
MMLILELMAPWRQILYNILIQLKKILLVVVVRRFFYSRLSMHSSGFVGMCLATDSGGPVNGIQYRQLNTWRLDGPSNDDTDDLK